MSPPWVPNTGTRLENATLVPNSHSGLITSLSVNTSKYQKPSLQMSKEHDEFYG